MCYAREKIGSCFCFYYVTVNPDLPRQILNFLSFEARKAGNTRWRETSIVFILMPHLSRDSGGSYNATKVRSCYSRRSSWNRRIQGSQTLRQSRDTLKNEGENNFYVDIAIKEIKKCSVAHRVGRVVFMLSILICHDWMWNHFNKVLICPVLLPQTNWI